jgi:hypothetical protein
MAIWLKDKANQGIPEDNKLKLHFLAKKKSLTLTTVMPISEINDNSELLGALFALNSRLESAPGNSDCQYTVAELCAWLQSSCSALGLVGRVARAAAPAALGVGAGGQIGVDRLANEVAGARRALGIGCGAGRVY